MMLFKNFSDITTSTRFELKRWNNVQCMPHCHMNMELICVLDGLLTVTVEDQIFTLEKNTCIMVLPYQNHSFYTENNSQEIIIVFAPELVNSFYIKTQNKIPKHSNFFIDENTLAFLLRKIENQEDYTEFGMKGMLYSLCDEFMRNNEMIEKTEKRNDLYSAAMMYLNDHYTEKITLKDVAKALNTHYVYLSTLFTKHSHTSFTKCLNYLRIRNAINLLNTTEKSITEISDASGFTSVRNLNRQFQLYVGTTPKNFRNTNTPIVSGTLLDESGDKAISQSFFT